MTATPPPLVGRDRELATLREQLAAALAGHGGLVLLGGEAGIGKTALAEALLREAEDQGATVLVGRCYDLSETPPYGPWRELFDRCPGYVRRFTRSSIPHAVGRSSEDAGFWVTHLTLRRKPRGTAAWWESESSEKMRMAEARETRAIWRRPDCLNPSLQ